MKKTLLKSLLREIKGSLGRYLAILAIVALGVGFFTGLRVTKYAMLETGNTFVKEQEMFDYRLLSTLGWTADDIEAFSGVAGVRAANGSVSADLLCVNSDGNEYTLRAHSITDGVNKLKLVAGRLPQADNECVADAWSYDETVLGTEIVLSANNTDKTSDMMSSDRYTIVGLVYSPYYLNFERGTTSVGNGKLSAYIYLLPESFDTDGLFTEAFLTLTDGGYIYSDEYNSALDNMAHSLKTVAKERAVLRYNKLLDEYNANYAEYEDNLSEFNTMSDSLSALLGKEFDEIEKSDIDAKINEINAALLLYPSAELQVALTALTELSNKFEDIKAAQSDLVTAKEELDSAKSSLDEIKSDIETDTVSYALDRRTNVGYICFENDSNIVEGISKVFPVFFILVAALVCSTTMSRMVDEQRTQIGVLRAMGYSDRAIMLKYSLYSGSSALLGCCAGYIGGSFLFPFVIWTVYDIMYGFADVIYVFNLPLALISLAVTLLCSVGVTLISCRREFSEKPAELIRPKSPKSGKRIFIERLFPFIWRKMKFLHKVSARNIFRYKKRLIMMIVGIGGCTALLITGFGIRDSITNIVNTQFGDISVYDGSVSFRNDMDAAAQNDFFASLPDSISKFLFVGGETVECAEDVSKQVELVVADNVDGFFNLKDGKNKVSYAGIGTTAISDKLANKLKLSVGDTITLRYGGTSEITLEISGIFDNYIYHYAFVTEETYKALTGGIAQVRQAYFNITGSAEPHTVSAKLQEDSRVVSVTLVKDSSMRFTSMISSLDYIVMLVTGCAAALALIVLYNLANINITERIREIATIKVLGFNRGETAQYVFRENLVLTAIGAFAGIFGGLALHAYVMNQIDINVVKFDTHIAPLSFILSLLLTFFFAYLVNMLLQLKLNRIDMAESLKSVE